MEQDLVALARKQPNPFAGSVLRNGFEAPTNDVPEIHSAQREKLRALVDEVRRTGELALQVVTGEPGDGKTHLLATLRAEAEGSWRQMGNERAMVPIEPLRDPEAPFGHILQCLVRGLRRPLADASTDPDSPNSPLEHILWRILRRAVEASKHPICLELAAQFGRYPSATAVLLKEHWSRLEQVLRDAGPHEADADVWAVLCRFPTHPQLVLRWLGGSSLPEEELVPLGVSRPLDGEDRAFRAISTLLKLSDVPIVFGFDQLEGVTRLGDGAVENFLQALGDQLYTSGGKAALLLFCQVDAWNRFASTLQNQVRDRLMQRPYLHLGSLDPALAEKLIERRLEAMWRGLSIKPPHATFPFAPGLVRQLIVTEKLKGPRQVLSFFAALGFDAAPATAPASPATPAQVALAEFERMLKETRADRNPDEVAAIAQSALCSVLEKARQVGDTAVIGARRGKHGLEVKLARAGKEVSAYAEASNSLHGMAAKAAAKRMQESLRKVDRALLLRDEGIPIPPLANKMISELGEKAKVVRIDAESDRFFAAIERLLNSAAAKDIDVSLEVATQVVLEQVAPQLSAIRQFLDAATGATAPTASPAPPAPVSAPARDRESSVLSTLEKPPFVASELQLAKAHGWSPEQVAETSDALERAGKVLVQRGKDGGRVVMRRPS